jgi:hypothetical protein
MQAQPNKVRIKGKQNEMYEEKLLAKAGVIISSANRIWRKINFCPCTIAGLLTLSTETQAQTDLDLE